MTEMTVSTGAMHRCLASKYIDLNIVDTLYVFSDVYIEGTNVCPHIVADHPMIVQCVHNPAIRPILHTQVSVCSMLPMILVWLSGVRMMVLNREAGLVW